MAIIVKDEYIQIDRLELGPFGTNSYILICQKTNESVVVDAPGEAGMVVDRLKETQPKYILMTHDHFDHIGGLVELRSALEVPVAAHLADANDLPLEPDLLLNDGEFPGGPGKTQSPADFRRIIESITQRLFVLPDETKVYPGHGEATTIKAAKQQYEVFSTRPHNPNLHGDVEWTSS
jgi:glyoxylase-like metal-dependent hydrolase (beta-lactamase superfamily II)